MSTFSRALALAQFTITYAQTRRGGYYPPAMNDHRQTNNQPQKTEGFCLPFESIYLSKPRLQDKVQNKQNRAYPKDRIDLLDLALAYLDDNVKDESCRDTVRNAVAQRHEDTREECGERFIKIVPINVLE